VACRVDDNSPVQRSRSEAGLRAVEAHTAIREGRLSFEDAARTYSDAPSAANGGRMGWVTREGIAEMPGSGVLFRLKPGEVSPVIEGEIGFFIYKVLPEEPRYYQAIFIRHRLPEETVGPTVDEARRQLTDLAAAITAGTESFDAAADRCTVVQSAPGGYIGEVVPGTKGAAFDAAVKDLVLDTVTPVFDDGTCMVLVRRCAPRQYTFSYIVFPGDPRTAPELQAQAADALAAINGDRAAFYALALRHHQAIGWEGPWYRISKDAYANALAPAVYAFLSTAAPGAVSAPIAGREGLYILLKEAFIPRDQ
jgi:parvulin-like peptidyl-prolyl isomerase